MPLVRFFGRRQPLDSHQSRSTSHQNFAHLLLPWTAALMLAACGGDTGSEPSPTQPPTAPVSFTNAMLQAYVKASNTESNDNFGSTGVGGTSGVAVSGNTLAISTSHENSCATGVNGDQLNTVCPDAGAVYVFTRTDGLWVKEAYLKASNTESNDRFGASLALHGDTLAVGALMESSCATGINGDGSNNGCISAGAVYVFTRTNGVWSQQAYIKASNTNADDRFGASVALYDETLVVGSEEDSCATGINGNQTDNGCIAAGAVYAFTRVSGHWTQQAYLKASNAGAFDHFGWSLSLSEDTLAVGAYHEESCAMGIDGDESNNECVEAGAVYVFIVRAGVWHQQAYVKASNAARRQEFGASVALNGNRLAVGAPREQSCATGINGNQSNNQCPEAGAVYVFTRTSGSWSQQAYVKPSNTVSDVLADGFGSAVTLSNNTLGVGSGEDSCATGIAGDESNNSCSVAGAVYIFAHADGGWMQDAYIKASNTETFDSFGNGLALDGNTLAVGAAGEDSCATGINGDQGNNGCPDAGAVYVYVAR